MMKDTLFELAFSFACLLFAVVVIAVAMLGVKYVTCASKAEAQGFEYEFGAFSGCMCKIDGVWIDYDKWRVME